MTQKTNSLTDLGSAFGRTPKQEKETKLELFETESGGLLVFINTNEKFIYMDKEKNFRRGGMKEKAVAERTWFDSWERKIPVLVSKDMKEIVLKYNQEKTFSM